MLLISVILGCIACVAFILALVIEILREKPCGGLLVGFALSVVLTLGGGFILTLTGGEEVSELAPIAAGKFSSDVQSVGSGSDSEETGGKDLQQTNRSQSRSRDNCDFRNAKWGDTVADIKKYEPDLNIVEETDSAMMASGTLRGYDVAIIYSFDSEGKFRDGMYGFVLNYTNPGQYILTYDTLKENLTEKYGNSEGGILPLNDQKSIDYAGEYNALWLGYVRYMDIWETDTTKITLSMYAEGGDITLLLSYTDITFEYDFSNEF